MITVAIPRVTPSGPRTVVNVDASAMPVTMPGSVMGRTTRKLMLCRPKNWKRCTANAAIVPSTRAMAAAHSPQSTEVASASAAPREWNASSHHCSVKPGGGKENVRELLNELSTIRSSGT
ncbi:hypothetical protein A0130_09650 [Leifsonia xyli]|nr:hypothetical protein A0130_09650 [Leifsonia xyli]